MKKAASFFKSSFTLILVLIVVLANMLFGWYLLNSFFGSPEPSKDAIEMWRSDGYEQGYNDGYDDGYSDGVADTRVKTS